MVTPAASTESRQVSQLPSARIACNTDPSRDCRTEHYTMLLREDWSFRKIKMLRISRRTRKFDQFSDQTDPAARKARQGARKLGKASLQQRLLAMSLWARPFFSMKTPSESVFS